ncbi:MAG: SusC/RagA family TonB-linked outer membrane protein, partial [Rikenellaceae bacterium]|nr:SusC/RagA family TonB-linked outer membrane protein [Rikenellaceae bacterium]
ALMDQYGVSRASAVARDNGGAPINFGLMDAQSYYTTAAAGKTGAALSEYTYSATNVRLRELSLGYALPDKWFRDKIGINVSFVARNLFMFYCKSPHDPELTSNTGTYHQGYDYFMPPSQRSLGFGVNISF